MGLRGLVGNTGELLFLRADNTGLNDGPNLSRGLVGMGPDTIGKRCLWNQSFFSFKDFA